MVDRHIREGRGDLTAFRFAGETVTYEGLHRAVLKRQTALGALGLRPGDRVAMVVRDEPSFAGWFLGSLRGGFIPVPLSTMLTPSEVGTVVADSGATVVIVSSSHIGHLPAIAETAPAVTRAIVLGVVDGMPKPRMDVTDETAFLADFAPDPVDDVVAVLPPEVALTDRESPAFWLYSSGTTGIPKGVMHRHGSLQATAETYATSVLDFRSDDKVLSIAKLFFAFGLGNSLTFPLAVGACAVLNPDPPTPSLIEQLLVNERPTLFFSSPGFIAALLDANTAVESFASVRLTVTAGEALPADLSRRFTERFGVPVLDGLGTSEALHIFLSNFVASSRPGTSGRAVPGYEIELRDEQGATIEAAESPGFLHVRGPSIASGYWQRPEATADAFVNGWLRTGDVYIRDTEGYYRFLGRNNDMIKAGGIWVSPAEVESVLIEHPDVLEAAVVGARNNDGLESTVAFVVARSGRSIDIDAIDRHCRSKMAAFKRPRRILVVDALPKTATGKVQRFALRKQLDTPRS